MRAFVDTNIFVRLLTGDDPAKAERCAALFEQVEQGDIALFTSEAIIGETVYVLTSKDLYAKTRVQTAQALRPLLELRGLHFDHKLTVLSALDRYETSNLAFEDCLAVEHAVRLGLDGIYSYDRKLGQRTGVNRLEP